MLLRKDEGRSWDAAANKLPRSLPADAFAAAENAIFRLRMQNSQRFVDRTSLYVRTIVYIRGIVKFKICWKNNLLQLAIYTSTILIWRDLTSRWKHTCKVNWRTSCSPGSSLVDCEVSHEEKVLRRTITISINYGNTVCSYILRQILSIIVNRRALLYYYVAEYIVENEYRQITYRGEHRRDQCILLASWSYTNGDITKRQQFYHPGCFVLLQFLHVVILQECRARSANDNILFGGRKDG